MDRWDCAGFGLDGRSVAETAYLEDGTLHASGRTGLRRNELERFAVKLRATDHVVLEATDNATAIVNVLRPHVALRRATPVASFPSRVASAELVETALRYWSRLVWRRPHRRPPGATIARPSRRPTKPAGSSGTIPSGVFPARAQHASAEIRPVKIRIGPLEHIRAPRAERRRRPVRDPACDRVEKRVTKPVAARIRGEQRVTLVERHNRLAGELANAA